MIPYSYKAFKSSELNFDGQISHSEIKRLDYIDLRQMKDEEKNNMVTEFFMKYQEDLESEGTDSMHYFFKDWCIRENCDNPYGYQLRYWRYRISDWNQEDKDNEIDSRTLTVDQYTYSRKSKKYVFDISLRFKLEHLYKIINDINNMYFDSATIDDINLYVLPIYEYNKYSIGDRYKRISDIAKEQRWTSKDLLEEFNSIQCSLIRFLAMNYRLVYTVNKRLNVNVYEYSLDPRDESVIMKKDIDIISYLRKARSDKRIKIDISNLEVNIDTRTPNVYVGTKPRKLCDYKYQVSGHWSHYWVGKKGNQTRIKKWIEPYFKNPDKEFRVIKEITNIN